MIGPMIHCMIRRDDLTLLVNEIAESRPAERESAKRALEEGRIDDLLDHTATLDVVLGMGGAPAALPLPLLWYVPVRHALRARGRNDIAMADYAASVPVAFAQTSKLKMIAQGDASLAEWWESIEALPPSTVAQAERAAQCGALALWWAGCFPEWVARGGHGAGMIRAYVEFASRCLTISARLVYGRLPDLARLYDRASQDIEIVRDALDETKKAYLGSAAHTSDGRIDRLLERITREFEN